MIDSILKFQVKEVISHSQGIYNPQVDRLLDDWQKAKSLFMIKFFGGDLEYTHPEKVTFELNNTAKEQRFNGFIEYVVNLLNLEFDDEFGYFLEQVGYQSFYNNKLDFDYINGGITIRKGTKVIKSFKHFINDDRLLEDIQNKASILIQENKVEGYLTFSVHPLDFLSSSENTLNWRSCHALDGEYRSGNLSYMCDTSTVICYLSSGDMVKLPRFPESVPWNNKKWRCLLHFDNKMEAVFAGRQYPFTSPGALDVVRDVFLSLLPSESRYPFGGGMCRPTWSQWFNGYIESCNFEEQGEVIDLNGRWLPIKHYLWRLGDIIKSPKRSLHYNDILHSSFYTKPYYMFREGWADTEDGLEFNIGTKVMCPICGEHPISHTNRMACNRCYVEDEDEMETTCDCCGNTMYRDDGYWCGDDYICQDCMSTQTFTCENCGELEYNTNKHWDEGMKKFLCQCCYNDIEGEEEDGSERFSSETEDSGEVEIVIW